MQGVYELNGSLIAGVNTPQKYGAIANGVSDCSTAIANLINDNLGKTIYFPEGIYAISSPVKTYPSFLNGVNIIFDPSAKIVPLNSMEYLLDIGGLSETIGNERGKRFIQGGNFDAYNEFVTKAVIHINAQNIDFSNANVYASGCSGIIVGNESGGGSSDAYLHNLYVRHAGGVNENSGIILYSSDNNVSDCRVYYFGVNINCYGGSEFLTDIHTLANGSNDTNQTTLIASGDIFLTDFYGDSEDVFVKTRENTSPRIHMNNCTYFSYKNRNVTLFDIASTAKLKVNGLNITCRANTEYTGIKMPFSSFKYILSMSSFDINGLQINNPQYMKNGDPLKGMRTNDKNTSFYPTSMTTGTWYQIGAIAVNDTNSHNIKIRSDKGITEIPVSIKCTSAGTLSVDTTSGKIITTDSGVYQIGYKLINTGFDSASEYPLVNMYIKRVSGGNRTLYRFDMESNLMARISPNGEYTAVLASSSDTPSIICNVDCDSETVSVLS